jgi:glutamate--cysteine ligase
VEILQTLEKLYNEREEEIERWLGEKRRECAPHFYNSVDLRHSNARLVPVDTNLYPAGFNNLSAAAEARAARFAHRYFDEHFPAARRVLLVPEEHTRNLHYLDNLLVLKRILESAGLEAEIGSLREARTLASLTGKKVVQQALTRDGGKLRLENGFTPDVIVLNNDLTSGIPPQLQGLQQPIVPPPEMGWHARRKSAHFTAYGQLAQEFAKTFGLDPWLIHANFHSCGRIDFKDSTGLECVAAAIDRLILRAAEKHAEYGIKEEPYVFVKADSGTYGMGVMSVRSGSEILDLNKKERNKMQVVKEGARVSEVIVQEGIPTADRISGAPAEPMIYLIDGIPVGGMYRVNAGRDAYVNLNAAGVEFTGMCDEQEAPLDCRQPVRDCNFRSFGLIAALAALAVPRERLPKQGDKNEYDCNNRDKAESRV